MSTSILYHAGFTVSTSVTYDALRLFGTDPIEIINTTEDRNPIHEAEIADAQSVLALPSPIGNILHINYGASTTDVHT